MNTETNSGVYEAPECEIIEMQQEGVLCGSSSVHDSYDEDIFGW